MLPYTWAGLISAYGHGIAGDTLTKHRLSFWRKRPEIFLQDDHKGMSSNILGSKRLMLLIEASLL